MSTDIIIVEQIPNARDYRRLRRAVGWDDLEEQVVQRGLQQSLYAVCAMRGNEIAGCGRVIGDGAIYFYIQDIIVLPELQAQGIGRQIMARIMDFIAAHASHNSFIALMAAQGVEKFYEKYGFRRRPDDRPGMFLIWKEINSQPFSRFQKGGQPFCSVTEPVTTLP